jgi:hypothetical protein
MGEENRDMDDASIVDEILDILDDELSEGEKLALIRECIGYTGRDAYGNG